MCHLPGGAEADHSGMDKARWDAGPPIPPSADPEIFLLQWLGTHHVYDGVGKRERAASTSLQVPILSIHWL